MITTIAKEKGAGVYVDSHELTRDVHHHTTTLRSALGLGEPTVIDESDGRAGDLVVQKTQEIIITNSASESPNPRMERTSDDYPLTGHASWDVENGIKG